GAATLLADVRLVADLPVGHDGLVHRVAPDQGGDDALPFGKVVGPPNGWIDRREQRPRLDGDGSDDLGARPGQRVHVRVEPTPVETAVFWVNLEELLNEDADQARLQLGRALYDAVRERQRVNATVPDAVPP